MKVTLSEFEEQFEQLLNAALHEPVEITKDGKAHLIVISLGEYENLTKRRAIIYLTYWIDSWITTRPSSSVSR